MTVTRGARVRVVHGQTFNGKPVERIGTVVRTPAPLGFKDAQGRPMFRATVKFPGDGGTYDLDVSEVVS
jgi:hypothetical protein